MAEQIYDWQTECPDLMDINTMPPQHGVFFFDSTNTFKLSRDYNEFLSSKGMTEEQIDHTSIFLKRAESKNGPVGKYSVGRSFITLYLPHRPKANRFNKYLKHETDHLIADVLEEVDFEATRMRVALTRRVIRLGQLGVYGNVSAFIAAQLANAPEVAEITKFASVGSCALGVAGFIAYRFSKEERRASEAQKQPGDYIQFIS